MLAVVYAVLGVTGHLYGVQAIDTIATALLQEGTVMALKIALM